MVVLHSAVQLLAVMRSGVTTHSAREAVLNPDFLALSTAVAPTMLVDLFSIIPMAVSVLSFFRIFWLVANSDMSDNRPSWYWWMDREWNGNWW